MSVSMLDLDLGVAAPSGGSTGLGVEDAASLLHVGMEVWVDDGLGGWPAYLLSREPPDKDGEERLRWMGAGPVEARLILRFAHGRSLYEWETEVAPLDGLAFETPMPERVKRCRARCEARFTPPKGMTLRFAEGSERRVVDLSRHGLRFGMNVLMDEMRKGDLVPALLVTPGLPALSARVEVQHISELGDDGPMTAGGTLELDHPLAMKVWSELVHSLAGGSPG